MMGGHTRLTEEQLRALPTPRLLTYYKKHYRVDRSAGWDDDNICEADLNRRNHRRLVRRIMNEREHVET